MFGDDPDSTVTTERGGFGTIFGGTHGGSVVVQRGGWAEKREEKAARQQFPETENV